MLRNYFKTAVRNLVRHRFFSAINIFGLSLAMSVCMAIIMLVADQLQYDRYNSKRDRVFRVNSIHIEKSTGLAAPDAIVSSTSPMPLKEELEKFTGTDQVVRFKRGFGNGWIEFENQDINVPLAGYFADQGVLQMFEYELQYGDANTALKEPYSVVLTRKAADKLFSDENPVGKTLKVGELGLYTVTGVLKKTENKTHIAFEALASMSSVQSLASQKLMESGEQDWSNFWTTWTYVQLKPSASPEDLQKELERVYDRHIGGTPEHVTKMRLQLQSLTEMTPGQFVNNPIGPSLPWVLVYILSGLAGVIMVTSCFNFTNLSIARSLTRAREIGVRKVNGATRTQIFAQFISEAVVVALCSLALSVAFLMLVKPLILQLSFARMFRWDLAANVEVYAVFLVFAIVVGLLAGAFPAIVLSGFQPVKVLKSLTGMRLFGAMGLRRVLLVGQFTLALIFILSVTVLYSQLDMYLNKDQGFDMENQLRVKLNKTNHEPLKNELLRHSNIESVTAVSHLPAAGITYGGGFKRQMSDPEWAQLDYFQVDNDYVANLKLTLVAGSFLNGTTDEANKDKVVLNERAVEVLQFKSAADAIGQTIIYNSDSTTKTVIGVVKDYNHQILMNNIAPLALMYDRPSFAVLQVKYRGTYTDAVKSVEQAWALVNPGLKMDVADMKTDVMMIYHMLFGDAVQILGFIAFLAIFISCLGLLGMATYATETRLKEVSIRKVLGSSNGSLIYLLSKGFMLIIVIAITLGVPAAWFLNKLWLELLPYHVEVDLPKILFGVAMLLLFAVVTVGSQTWRATFVNPVDNLKSE